MHGLPFTRQGKVCSHRSVDSALFGAENVQTFRGKESVLCVDSTVLRNIVEPTISEFTANPVKLTDTDVSEFFC